MKKLLAAIFIFVLLLSLTACAGKTDYPAVSQLRTDILYASDGNYEVTVYKEERELPLLADGVALERTPVLVVKIHSLTEISGTFTVFAEFDGKRYSAQPEHRAANVLHAVMPVEALPAGEVTVTVKSNEEVHLKLSSIIPEGTAVYTAPLATAINRLADKLRYDGKAPLGEFQVRILCENATAYWYVGYVTDKEIFSLLLSADGKEIIATRQAENL